MSKPVILCVPDLLFVNDLTNSIQVHGEKVTFDHPRDLTLYSNAPISGELMSQVFIVEDNGSNVSVVINPAINLENIFLPVISSVFYLDDTTGVKTVYDVARWSKESILKSFEAIFGSAITRDIHNNVDDLIKIQTNLSTLVTNALIESLQKPEIRRCLYEQMFATDPSRFFTRTDISRNMPFFEGDEFRFITRFDYLSSRFVANGPSLPSTDNFSLTPKAPVISFTPSPQLFEFCIRISKWTASFEFTVARVGGNLRLNVL